MGAGLCGSRSRTGVGLEFVGVLEIRQVHPCDNAAATSGRPVRGGQAASAAFCWSTSKTNSCASASIDVSILTRPAVSSGTPLDLPRCGLLILVAPRWAVDLGDHGREHRRAGRPLDELDIGAVAIGDPPHLVPKSQRDVMTAENAAVVVESG